MTVLAALAGKGPYRLQRRCRTYDGVLFGNYSLTKDGDATPLAGGDMDFFLRNWGRLTADNKFQRRDDVEGAADQRAF